MSRKPSESECVGLCFSCVHARVVRSDRGSLFYQCLRSLTDPNYPKYPRLPMRQCPGYEAIKKEEPEPSG
jgi:hypothetical protein